MKEIKNKLIFPVNLEKLYGGEIMAQSLLIAMKNIPNDFYLVSFTTHYFHPLHSRNYDNEYNVEGGGHTIKFVSVTIKENDKICVRTDFVFGKSETTELILETGKDINDFNNCHNKLSIKYTEYYLKAITKLDNLSLEIVHDKYKEFIGLIKYFEVRNNLKITEDDKILITLKDIKSKEEFYTEFAFISDFIIVQHAAKILKFRLHDLKKNVLFSLKQTMSFNDNFLIGNQFVLDIQIKLINSAKAFVEGTLYNDKNIVCTLNQIMLFRERKN